MAGCTSGASRQNCGVVEMRRDEGDSRMAVAAGVEG